MDFTPTYIIYLSILPYQSLRETGEYKRDQESLSLFHRKSGVCVRSVQGVWVAWMPGVSSMFILSPPPSAISVSIITTLSAITAPSFHSLPLFSTYRPSFPLSPVVPSSPRSSIISTPQRQLDGSFTGNPVCLSFGYQRLQNRLMMLVSRRRRVNTVMDQTDYLQYRVRHSPASRPAPTRSHSTYRPERYNPKVSALEQVNPEQVNKRSSPS